jgi:transforming growth factor-beta-induced protein
VILTNQEVMTHNNYLTRTLFMGRIFVLTLLMAFTAISCDDEDEDNRQNIVQLAQGNSNLSSLVQALTKFPDLVTTLSASGNFTVFAPDNAAFDDLLTFLELESIDEIPQDILRDVLEYHVIASAKLNANQLQSRSYATVNGESITVAVNANGVVLNGSVNVTTANVDASNGVVHIIDAVLVPAAVLEILTAPTQNIVQLVQANPNLSTLVAALTKFPDLVTTLSGNGTFTVFAPTNTAFTNLLGVIGQPSLDVIPESVLRKILEYHVVSSATVASTALTNGTVNTVSQELIQVNVSNGVVLNGNSTVTTADVEATNGIVHVVNAVLVNPSIAPIVNTVVEPAYFNKDFSTLTAAVVQAGLLNTLINPASNLTVFAPTNAAFEAAGITALPTDNIELGNILKYHVLTTEVVASALPSGSASIATLLEKNFYLSNNGSAGVFINGKTRVTATDIQANNGVVHVINRTLLPPSDNIAEIVTTSAQAMQPQFTQLLAALQLVPTLVDAASDESANLTVFAPTDAAFEALYASLEVEDLDGVVDAIGLAGLEKVLKHHIVGTRAFSTDLQSGSLATLEQSVSVNTTTLKITGASGSANEAGLVATSLNILATNGVVHVIDKVLLPQL